jgi:Fe-S-cluster containining protein
MTLAPCLPASLTLAMPLSLSALEKYLLRRGLVLTDGYDAASRRVITRACDSQGRPALAYVHPAYDYHGLDRGAQLAGALAAAGEALGMSPQAVAEAVAADFAAQPEGFACRRCAACCTGLRDAYQGRVSREEVDWWRLLGREDVLRFVSLQERPDYVLYAAWVNPKTGGHFKRCPWLRTEGGRKVCHIHEVRPLKCRSFPLSREQAERLHCPAFEEQAEMTPALPGVGR